MSNPTEPLDLSTMRVDSNYVDVAFYREDTGLATGQTYQGPVGDLEVNTPVGVVPMKRQGRPHLKKLKDGELIDYQPPAPEPAADYQWNTESTEWELTAVAHQIKIDDAVARATIDGLEHQQARALREFALGDKTAVDRLKAIDDSIADKRNKLQSQGGS